MGAGGRSSNGPGRWLPLRGLLLGLVAGAAWGALARLWMRLITTADPGFTWSGTLFVVGVFALTGALGGLVHGARQRGWRGRPMVSLRVLGVLLPLVLLSAGPGAVLAPTLLLGGLALARRTWPGWWRALLAVLALAAVVAVHVDAAQDWPHSTARLLTAGALCSVAWGGAAAALAQGLAPARGATLPRAAVWLLPPVLLLPVLLLVGLRSPQQAAPLVGGTAVALVLGVLVLVRRRRAVRRLPAQRLPSAPPGDPTAAPARESARAGRDQDRTTPG